MTDVVSYMELLYINVRCVWAGYWTSAVQLGRWKVLDAARADCGLGWQHLGDRLRPAPGHQVQSQGGAVAGLGHSPGARPRFKSLVQANPCRLATTCHAISAAVCSLPGCSMECQVG